MNEEIAKQIAELGELTKDGVINIVDTLQAEAPETIRQLLWWEGCISAFQFGVGVVVVFLCAKYICRVWVWGLDEDRRDASADISVLAGIGVAIGGLIGVFVAINSWTWLQILIAPRIFLIEYIANICK